jgi:hypothetical protein
MITDKKYEGEFVNGLFHGRGVFNFGDGNIYSGEFEHSKFCGQGTLVSDTGNKFEGIETMRH